MGFFTGGVTQTISAVGRALWQEPASAQARRSTSPTARPAANHSFSRLDLAPEVVRLPVDRERPDLLGLGCASRPIRRTQDPFCLSRRLACGA